jgi:uncharacterized protein (DUF362 family)
LSPYVKEISEDASSKNEKHMDIEKIPGFLRYGRRAFLRNLIAAPLGMAWGGLFLACGKKRLQANAFIGKADHYGADLALLIRSGLQELGVAAEEIRGKRILLKANLVEPHKEADHIVTNPAVVSAAAEVFLSLGAARIIVAEAPGHCRDTYMALEESGFDGLFTDRRISFADLNYDEWWLAPNLGRTTSMGSFVLPATLKQADWIVSMPKLKTHHWVGATLSMKNLFGILPGEFYGWPKNIIHTAGINNTVFDINSTLHPHFAIVDGIVGMEGDGPIMGTAKKAGILAMGRNLPAVDATCARLMGINPYKIRYLANSDGKLGPIGEAQIGQRGEKWQSVRTDFQLLDYIEAHRGLRL